MMRILVVSLALVLAATSAAFADGKMVFGSGAERIELVKEVSSLEREIGFAIPGASGLITPLPVLQVVAVSIATNDGYTFDFRYSPVSPNPSRFDLAHFDEGARQAYEGVARGARTLANLLADAEEFAAYTDIFAAVAENRGIISARRDRNLLTVARYREAERRHSCTVTDVDLGERRLSIRQCPSRPEECEVSYDALPGNRVRLRLVEEPMGVVAWVSGAGLPPNLSNRALLEELGTYLSKLSPVLAVCSHNNEKVNQVRDEVAKLAATVRAVSFIRTEEPAAPAAGFEPRSEYSAYAEPALGYTVYLREENVSRRIYYFRTLGENGFILQDTYPKYSHVVVAASRELFDPDPVVSERLPMYDFLWEAVYPRMVGEPGFAPSDKYSGGGFDLTDRDLFFYRETANLFDRALVDQGFRDAVPGDLILSLRKYCAMSGMFRGEEAVSPLIALSYREVQGLANIGVLKYQDQDFLYQLTLPANEGYINFAFSFEDALVPEIYRFFLAPAGGKTQLVASYPVELPIGRAARRFNRCASALVRLRDLTAYLARHDALLADVPPLINEIWRQRELIGPKMFIRPSLATNYPDWLTAATLGTGGG